MKHIEEPSRPSVFQDLTEGSPPQAAPKKILESTALLCWFDLAGGALPGLIHHFATAQLAASPAAGFPELASQTRGS